MTDVRNMDPGNRMLTRGVAMAVALFLGIGALLWVSGRLTEADAAEPRSSVAAQQQKPITPPPISRRCVEDNGSLCPTPQRYATLFKKGKFGTAAGRQAPKRIYRMARAYVKAHPNSVRRTNARGFDPFAPVKWLDKKFVQTQCLTVSWVPTSITHCDKQFNDWDKVKSIQLDCGGSALIVFGISRNPLGAVGTGSTCFWLTVRR